MMLFEMRALLLATKWTADAISSRTKIPAGAIAAWLEDDKALVPADAAKLSIWIEMNSGVSGTSGKPWMAEPPVTLAMGEIVSPPVMPGKLVDVDTALTVVDADKTAAAIAAYGHGNLTGVGVGITAEKVLAGKQVVKKESAKAA